MSLVFNIVDLKVESMTFQFLPMISNQTTLRAITINRRRISVLK